MASLFAGSTVGRAVGKATQKRAKGLSGPGGSEQYTGIDPNASNLRDRRPQRLAKRRRDGQLGPVRSPLAER